MKTERRSLRTTLGEHELAELAELAKKLVDTVVERDATIEERTIIYKTYKEKLTGINERISDLAAKVNTKGYYEDIECQVSPLWQSKRVQVTRMDTGEVIETRAMTESEKQPGFDFDGINAPAKAEDSEANVAGFFDKGEEETADDEGDADSFDADDHENLLPEADPVERDEFDTHPQCNAGGCYLPAHTNRYEIPMTGLDFKAFVLTIKDIRDEQWHLSFGFGSTAKPIFKGQSKPSEFCPEGPAFSSEGTALMYAGQEMIHQIKSDAKWSKVESERAVNIIGEIERFQAEQTVSA